MCRASFSTLGFTYKQLEWDSAAAAQKRSVAQKKRKKTLSSESLLSAALGGEHLSEDIH